MDAVEMLKEKIRLTDSCNIYCTACRLGPDLNGRDVNCTEFQQKHPEQYVAIIEKWGKDCPRETYLSKLLEVFPGTNVNDDGAPVNMCPSDLGLKDLTICSQSCIDCWKQVFK